MRFLFSLVIIFVAIVLTGYLLDYIGFITLEKPGFSAAVSQTLDEKGLAASEKKFEKPVEVEWDGEIFGVLQSGNGYAVRRPASKKKENYYPEFQAYYPDDKLVWLEGRVKIKGLWEGIDCAYQNTVFNGQCVPLMTIEKIESINE